MCFPVIRMVLRTTCIIDSNIILYIYIFISILYLDVLYQEERGQPDDELIN